MKIYWTALLEDYHLIVERSFANPNDPESYAGGSAYGHPCQTGQRAGARQSIVPGLLGWGLSVWLTTQTPKKLQLQNLMEETRHTKGCSTSRKEEKITYN